MDELNYTLAKANERELVRRADTHRLAKEAVRERPDRERRSILRFFRRPAPLRARSTG
jgi:hypothetical protein